ncbi:hypothetical protein F7725_009443 [Dissostichus mawsoni]|uniref:Uncharacterized protein n=1 Tax=Dissostichus mawsoni TaxID=36200 RepID=A0A7J5XKR0_DISMA|nr:hypothetical protein F7725_009443 [Dissostichus mawsoni]
MNDIVAGVQQYQSSLLDNLRTQMKEVLKKNSGSTTNQLEKDAMDIFDSFIDPFANVSTTFRQNSVIRKQFCCVDAEEIPIARTLCRKKRGGSTDFVIKDKLFYYVPLVKSVEQFLLHPRILTMIEEGPQRCSEGFFHDLVDGSLLKSHPLFSEKPNALQIILTAASWHHLFAFKQEGCIHWILSIGTMDNQDLQDWCCIICMAGERQTVDFSLCTAPKYNSMTPMLAKETYG